MKINADTVTVQNGATMSATTRGSGQGGTLTVNATGAVALTGPSSGLFTDSQSSGAGGSVALTSSDSVTMSDGASIAASSTGPGNAGTVQLTDSRINASVADGSGGGGNISIDPQHVILQNSQILAQAAQWSGRRDHDHHQSIPAGCH